MNWDIFPRCVNNIVTCSIRLAAFSVLQRVICVYAMQLSLKKTATQHYEKGNNFAQRVIIRNWQRRTSELYQYIIIVHTRCMWQPTCLVLSCLLSHMHFAHGSLSTMWANFLCYLVQGRITYGKYDLLSGRSSPGWCHQKLICLQVLHRTFVFNTWLQK